MENTSKDYNKVSKRNNIEPNYVLEPSRENLYKQSRYHLRKTNKKYNTFCIMM